MMIKSPFLLSLAAWCFLSPLRLSAYGQETGSQQLLSPRQIVDNLAAKRYAGRRIDLVMSNSGLQEIMAELEKAGGVRLELDPSINDKATYRLRDVPWDEALAAVLADHGLNMMPNLQGTGFKIGRGQKVVLAFPDTGRAKFVVFLYERLFQIVAAAFLLTALAVGFLFYRKKRASRPKTPKKALMTTESAERTKKELVRLLQEERLYRDEGLTLPSLAERLSISSHQLSWILNEELQLSFHSLINNYRIEEAKSRLSDPSFDKTPILQIALDAGFNTKASFNKTFKENTGMTPSQFKKAHLDRSPLSRPS